MAVDRFNKYRASYNRGYAQASSVAVRDYIARTRDRPPIWGAGVAAYGITLIRMIGILLLAFSIIKITMGGTSLTFTGLLDWLQYCPQIPTDWLKIIVFDFTTLMPKALEWLGRILNIFSSGWSFILWFSTTVINCLMSILWVVSFLFS